MKLTSKERIERVFRGEEIDRPVFKLWGHGINTDYAIHPAYLPINRLAAEKTDLFEGCWFPINIYAGQNWGKYAEVWSVETPDPNWRIRHTTLHTPKGDLHSEDYESTRGDPGYTKEYMVKDEEDIERLLSMDYTPYPLDLNAFESMTARVGERGVVMVGIEHAAYAVQRMTGSETLAYLSVDARDSLKHLIEVYAARLYEHTDKILSLGIKHPIFSWVGPELYQPPLMSFADFEEFVHDFDKPIGDAVHNAGGYVWVHSHGKVAKLIDSFIDMGVDVLNPLEPPKNGDIDMNAIVEKYGNRIGWEGNIEIQEILLSDRERLRLLIDECVSAGWKSGRFILCPSAGYMEYPRPTDHYIENLEFYLNYGYEAVERCRG